MAKTVTIGKKNEVPEGGAKAFEVEGRKIGVFHVDGNYYAIENCCTHEEAPLTDGELDEDTVICPWHGSEFNVKTGEVLCPPATEGVKTYKVTVDGDDLAVEIE